MTALLLIGALASFVLFTLVFFLSVRVKNYALLDVAFSYGVALLAPLYAALGPGLAERRWMMAAAGAAWSLRLGTHILRRVVHEHPVEDVRYQTLREKWKGKGMFFLFFQMQAVLVVIFSLPFLIMSFNAAPALTTVEWAGLVLALVSLAGEAVADWQLRRFKADPAKRGGVCQDGLWGYSRHPNYFFESMIWWSFFLAALGSPLGWTTLICPLLMLYFLWKVTGIPLTEEYAVRRKGEAYREYQRTVSAFVPWFRKAPRPS